MRRPSSWLRRVEIALWFIGVCLLGVALEATVDRQRFQAKQERLLDQRRAATTPQQQRRLTSNLTSSTVAPKIVKDATAPPVASPTRQSESAEERAAPPPATFESLPAMKTLDPRPSKEKVEAEAEEVDPSVIGRIEIPRIGLSAVVSKGDDEAVLRRAVGWVTGTAGPGDGGNTALAGHRDTFFRPLQRVRVDDRIRLVMPDETLEYRVASTQVVEPDDISVLQSSGKEELTLITCYPFRFIGPAPDRFIVKATRVH